LGWVWVCGLVRVERIERVRVGMGVGEVVEPQRMDTVGSVGSHVGGRRRNVVTTAGLTATVGVSSTGITRGESAVEGAGGRLEAGAELEEGAVKAPDLNRKRFRHRLDPLPLSGLAPPMAFHSISADKPVRGWGGMLWTVA